MSAVDIKGIIGQKILVVDDNPASLYATSRILRAARYEVITAATGSEALKLADDTIGLVVLDINLPDIDGFEVCRQLRARGDTAYLPVMHLSATFTNSADFEAGLAAGADSYLTHPVEPEVLAATVRALLFARRADMVRRQADARFRTVFDLASSGIVLVDQEHRYADVNPAFCKIAGTSRSELIGTFAPSVLAPGCENVLESAREQLERSDAWEGTAPVARPDGSRAEVEWRLVREAATGSYIGIATDVTERLRAETEREHLLASERAARGEAERGNRIKDEFLATLSHELRNPLNAILGWTNVLLRTPSSVVVKQGLEAIERNSKVQSHLIADLLDFAGLRFGKMRLDFEVIDPMVPIKAAMEIVKPQSEAKNIVVDWRFTDLEARILADSGRIQQIVWNLLSNAIKFTSAGGEIGVSCGVEDGYYKLVVRDSGKGISPEFLPQIFDRFSQQDSGRSKNYAGLGIGLSIVKHFAEMHHGTIDVASAGEGRGATFTVRLPLTQEQLTVPLITAAPELLAGKTVLVVEDDADTRALIARMFSDRGAIALTATGAEEAIELVGRQLPDILVSDIGMPGKDGYQLIRALRASDLSAHDLPAIALTAFSRPQDQQDAMEAGFQAHLTKPVNGEVLMSTAARLIAKSS